MTNRHTGDKVLRCICNCIYSDEFMIQCDQCYIWQHVICVGLDGKHIPDDYYCEECVPRPVNKDYANSVQKKLGNTSDKTVASDQGYDQPITTIPKLDVKMYEKLIRIAPKSALIRASSPVAQTPELISGLDSHNDISNSAKRISDEKTTNYETHCTICGEMQDPDKLKPDKNSEKISQAPKFETSQIHCHKSSPITTEAEFIEMTRRGHLLKRKRMFVLICATEQRRKIRIQSSQYLYVALRPLHGMFILIYYLYIYRDSASVSPRQ